jgi:hypothetical protein
MDRPVVTPSESEGSGRAGGAIPNVCAPPLHPDPSLTLGVTACAAAIQCSTIARMFTTGRKKKESRSDGDTSLIHDEGPAVVVEPSSEWPDKYVESFSGIPDDFERPAQGNVERRRKP